MRTASLYVFVFAILIPVARAEEPDAEVQRCIKQLGADAFGERDAAETQLLKLGLRAKAALESAVKSEDAEVQLRASRILAQLWDLDARENEAAWSEKIGVGLGAAKLNALIDKEKAPPLKDSAPKAGDKADAELALAWLAQAQEPNGNWDSKKFGAQTDGDLAQTGLALLAFLGAGHTEKVGTYKLNLQRGVAWLKSRQRADGAFCNRGEAVDGIAHGVCGLAMAEAAGMARRPDTVASAQKAIDYSTKLHQSRSNGELSGFGRARDSKAPNLFVTTLFVMQMKSAKVAGLNVPHESFDGAIKFLDSVEEKTGYRLRPGEGITPQLTIMANLARQFLGWKKEDLQPTVAAAIKELGAPAAGAENSNDLITWIATLCVFQQGGQMWKDWNSGLMKDLAEKQAREGAERGSWPPGGVWAGAGRVAATAFNALTVEVQFRYQLLEGK